jgi:hypothetical protein
MMRKVIPLFFALMLGVGRVIAQAQNCPEIVENAVVRAQNACVEMRRNQACYGYHFLSAELSPGLTSFAFNDVGDITPVDTIRSLHLSALDPVTDQWGVAMMRVRADIADTAANQNVTLVAFGSVALEADSSGLYQPMQAFTFSSDDTASSCADVTEDGLLIQTPEGVGRVTLWINQVKIRIGSTVLFQAEPGGDLTVSTFEGSALVEAFGQVQEAAAGMSVRVPMDIDLQPAAPPSIPEPFDGAATGLTSLLNLSEAYTDGIIPQVETANILPTAAVTDEFLNHSSSEEVNALIEELALVVPISTTTDRDRIVSNDNSNNITPPPEVVVTEDVTAEPTATEAVTSTDVATPGEGDPAATVTSEPTTEVTPVPTAEDTSTPEVVATPSPEGEGVTPTAAPTDDCNRDNGLSRPNGKCYGHDD